MLQTLATSAAARSNVSAPNRNRAKASSASTICLRIRPMHFCRVAGRHGVDANFAACVLHGLTRDH